MIIGITGWFAGGKDTVGDYLVEKKGYKRVSLSDIIRDHLRAEGKELIRENLLQKGNELRAEFGTGYLAEQALKKINETGGDWVVPAVRQTGEVEALKKSPDFELWEIYAPIEIRFQRMQARNKGGEDDAIKTIDDLVAKEEQEKSGANNAPQIDLTTAMADRKIDNSGNFDDLYQKIDKIILELGEK
ncbi:MAG: AAA family ATPase [Patescibacteria group bacterium]|jgi:dephospho-CoA kinase